MRTTNLVQDVTRSTGGAPSEEPLYEFTPEQIEALEATRAKLNLTPEEREAFEERQRRLQAEIERWAAAETLEESQRMADRWWIEHIERPRAARRIAAARRAKTRPVRLVAVIRPRSRGAGRPRAAAARSSAASGDSGDDSDSEPPAAIRWRWASEASWQSFVASVESRDFEAELHRERMSGWTR